MAPLSAFCGVNLPQQVFASILNGLKPAERDSKLAKTQPERVSEPVVKVSWEGFSVRVLEPAGRASEPAGGGGDLRACCLQRWEGLRSS